MVAAWCRYDPCLREMLKEVQDEQNRLAVKDVVRGRWQKAITSAVIDNSKKKGKNNFWAVGHSL